MQPTSFSCPNCSARLRVRDRSQIGRVIDCPECRGRFVLKSGSHGTLEAEAANELPDQLKDRIRPAWSRQNRTPLLAAWAAIFLATAGGLWIVVRERSSGRPPATQSPAALDLAESHVASPPANLMPDIVVPVDDMLPIDVAVAEDSAHREAAAKTETEEEAVAVAEPAIDPEDLRPIDVPLADDIPQIDVAAQLDQPVFEFSQETPVEVRRMLREIAELSAVPIDTSRVEAGPYQERLNRQVTLALRETTVGAILDALIQQADLRFEIQDGVIFVSPAEAP